MFAIVEVPDLGRVRIQSLTQREVWELRQWLNADDEETAGKRWNMLDAALVVRCLVDESGNRLFRLSEVEAGTFDEWRAGLLKGLGETCNKHTGFSQGAYDLERVESIAGN